MAFKKPPIDTEVSEFVWKEWFNQLYREVVALIAGTISDGDKGDITVSSSGTTWNVDNDAITNAKLANMATQTFKGRTTAGTGDPEDLTVAQAKTMLNLVGTNSGDQTITLTGDVTGSGTGSFAATIANDAVSNAKLANMATQTIKGRTTAGSGDPEDLTAAQALAVVSAAGPKFFAYRNSTESIGTGAWTKISYNIELYDTNANYDPTTNFRFTPTVAGYYRLSCIARWSWTPAAAGKIIGLRLYRNGSAEIARDIQYPINAYACSNMMATTIYYFNGSSDYVEVEAYQDSGSNQNIVAGIADCQFCGEYIGA